MAKDSSFFVLPFLGGQFAVNDLPGSSTAAAAIDAASNASVLASLSVATVGAMGLYLAWTRNWDKKEGKIVPLVNPSKQTRVLEDGSRICNYTESNELRMYAYSDAKTVFEVVHRGARVSNNGPMLGYRCKDASGAEPYVWMRYSEVIERSEMLARGIRHLGIAAGQDAFIGVYSKNRPEWIVVEQATYAFNNVLVPLYETLGPDACGFIVKQAAIEIVFCDTVEKIEGVLKSKQDSEFLKYVVLMTGEPNNELKERASALGVAIYSFEEVERFGSVENVAKIPLIPPTPEDLATICYTSGTTGNPKGVMLTHGNIIADSTIIEYFKYTKLNAKDVMMSFLPLAHMFERIVQSAVYTNGGSVGFFRGDIHGLADDIKTLRPTILPVVPRVLNRLYDKVLAEASKCSVVKRILFDTTLMLKRRELNNWIVRKTMLDSLVFKKVREGLGGRVKLMITGSAPISESVLSFIRCAVGCVVVEGYGQTECVAACAVTIEGDFEPGHVGVPAPCNIIKLVDVPELGYFAKDQAGEVCIKGTNVFKGYYKMPELTRETIVDGWLHTGDIGRWTDRGTLKIVDRKKHIFKLAQGEYVAPEKIENIYTRSKFVAQCFVYGECLKTCLIGIVVPDHEVLIPMAKTEFGIDASIEELCHNEKIKKAIMTDMTDVGKKTGLFTFEQVKDIFLSPEMFSVENNLLTPTLKSKRVELKTHFRKQLEDMYKNFD